jgi:hypothetical protein
MPINRLLVDSDLTPEQRHVVTLAFNNALHKLDLVGRNDPVCDLVARKVIEIGTTEGVTNALAIAEIALRQLRPHR